MTDTTTQTRSRLPKSQELTIGKIGRFELKSALGQGAFGTVYKAYDPVLDRLLALKIPKFSSSEKRKIRRFVREAKAAASLHHPNIVAVFESGQVDNRMYIASELIDGTPMSSIVAEGPCDYRQAAKWVVALAEGLAYAHEFSIVHRDIKPDNIMVSKSGNPQIMDFGLAKRLDEDSSMTTDGGVIGTPAYMPPEQARGDIENVGTHSDQYSLGVVLYELLTGKRPFSGPPHSVIAQIASTEPPELRQLDRRIPIDLAAICSKAMEKDPANRYPDMTAMASDLERWLSGRETKARPISRWEKTRRWATRNRSLASALGAVAILLVVWLLGATVAVGYFRQQEQKQRQLATENLDLANNNAKLANESQAALDESKRAQRSAEKRLVEQYVARGRSLCEAGNQGLGLQWLVRALAAVPEHERDMELAIRRDLDAFAKPVHQLAHLVQISNEVTSVDISKDGSTIAAVTGGYHHPNGELYLIDTATGQLNGLPRKLNESGWAVKFCHDDNLIAVGVSNYSGGELSLFNRATNSFEKQTLVIPGMIRSMVVHPHKSVLAATTHNQKFLLWDWSTESVFKEFPEDIKLTAKGFSPDGDDLLISSRPIGAEEDNGLRLWNLERKTFEELPSTFSETTSLATFSPDGSKLATKEGGGISVWDITSGNRLIGPFLLDVDPKSLQFASDGETISVSAIDGTVHIWSLSTEKRIGQMLHHKGLVHSCCFHPGGKQLVTGAEDGCVRIWQVAEEQQPVEADLDGPIFSLSVSPENEFLLVAQKLHETQVLSAETLEVQMSLKESHGYLSCLAVGGQYGFVDHDNNRVELWDLKKGIQIAPPLINNFKVSSCSAAPDGTHLAVGTGATDLSEGQIEIFDVRTGQKILSPLKLNSPPLGVCYSPSGALIAAGTTGGLAHVFDAQTGEQIFSPIQHGAWIDEVGFTIDGKMLVTGCFDGIIRLFDSTTGKPNGKPLDVGTKISAMRCAPDGRTLAVGAESGIVQIWDIPTRRQIGRTWMHPMGVTSMDFNWKNQRLISGDAGSYVRSWAIPQFEPRSSERIQTEVELATGVRLSTSGEREFLSAKDWNSLREAFQQPGDTDGLSDEVLRPQETQVMDSYQTNSLEASQRWQTTLAAVADQNNYEELSRLRAKAGELLNNDDVKEAIPVYEEILAIQVDRADCKTLYSLYARTMQWEKALEVGSKISEGIFMRDKAYLLFQTGRFEEYRDVRKLLLAEAESLTQDWQYAGHLSVSSLLPIEADLYPAMRLLSERCANGKEQYQQATVGKGVYRLGEFDAWYERLAEDSPLKNGQAIRVRLSQFQKSPTEENRKLLQESGQYLKDAADKLAAEGVLEKYWWNYIETMAWAEEAERVLSSK